MTNQLRRGDSGLGITARGGNGGSFAPHTRSRFAPPPPPPPPPHREVSAPDSALQGAWNDMPRDLLPEDAPDGATSGEWGEYVRWRKMLRTDAIPEELNMQRASYELREAWNDHAQLLGNQLADMRGVVPISDPSWSVARDRYIQASAMAANPHATGVRVTATKGRVSAVKILGVVRDPRFQKTSAEHQLVSRVSSAIGAAGDRGLFWREEADGSAVTFISTPR